MTKRLKKNLVTVNAYALLCAQQYNRIDSLAAQHQRRPGVELLVMPAFN